jgi:oligoribonuclease NrnB/cAMP/cGMP phosphodiesterase (DHH superfamily)
MKCFYHKVDLDGKCSAAIVKDALSETRCVPFDYGEQFPWESIQPREAVFLVDISLRPEDMAQLNQLCELVWIDHHQTAIQAIDQSIAGAREVGKAGCELTWGFLHQEALPLGVLLLGRYDVWDQSDKKLWNEKILPFQLGMKSHNASPENQALWTRVFTDEDFVSALIERGQAIQGFQAEQNRATMERSSHEGTFAGYKAIFCNAAGGSQLFDKFYDAQKHDLMVAYVMDKHKVWKVSLYTERPDLDVSALAKKFGGGGHRQAAGFESKDLSFIDS